MYCVCACVCVRLFEGVQKLKFVNILPSRRDIGGFFAKRMAWGSEKCDGQSLEAAKMGLVRPATEDYAEEAIEAVRAGKVIAVPTDTLYGFACDAWYIPYTQFFICAFCTSSSLI